MSREPPHPHEWSQGTWSYGYGQAVTVGSGLEGKGGRVLDTSKLPKLMQELQPSHTQHL